jgi:serine phosphatase RsbU (regulator of sigma subunit)
MTLDYYKEQLAAKEEMLAQTTRFLTSTQKLLEEKNKDLISVNNDIFDSIRFAAMIQKSLLPDVNILKVFFKDAAYRVMQQIGIGGDNVIIKNTNNGVLFGLLDSTGHGIPAALLSISGTVVLKEFVYSMEINNPKSLLHLLNQQLHTMFNHGGYKIAQKEGVIFHFLSTENKLTYCSAKGKGLYIKRSGEINPLEVTKKSIGEDLEAEFDLFEIDVNPGDKLVIYSDGLLDQFGGEDNRKFTIRRLKALLETAPEKSASELAERIEEEFLKWKGTNLQTDDVSFIVIEF